MRQYYIFPELLDLLKREQQQKRSNPPSLTTQHVAALACACFKQKQLMVWVFFFLCFTHLFAMSKVNSFPTVTPNNKQFESMYSRAEVVKTTST
jgi:hypothetical protein